MFYLADRDIDPGGNVVRWWLEYERGRTYLIPWLRKRADKRHFAPLLLDELTNPAGVDLEREISDVNYPLIGTVVGKYWLDDGEWKFMVYDKWLPDIHKYGK